MKIIKSYKNLDSKYDIAGYAISTVFKNWKKFLVIVLTILLFVGLLLLLLLPGYKCQTKTGTFEKTPVELPGKSKLRSENSN